MMNKKIVSSMVTGAVVLGLSVSVIPMNVLAATSNADMAAQTLNRKPGQSMLLSMSEAATIFLTTYPDSAVHSISLRADKGQFVYQVEGYTLKNTYKISIDVITGAIKKQEVSGREKNLVEKIFNPANVIAPHVAEAKAVSSVGEGAIAKGWKVEAEKGKVTYTVTVHHNGMKIDVVVDATTGSVLSQSKGEAINKD